MRCGLGISGTQAFQLLVAERELSHKVFVLMPSAQKPFLLQRHYKTTSDTIHV